MYSTAKNINTVLEYYRFRVRLHAGQKSVRDFLRSRSHYCCGSRANEIRRHKLELLPSGTLRIASLKREREEGRERRKKGRKNERTRSRTESREHARVRVSPASLRLATTQPRYRLTSPPRRRGVRISRNASSATRETAERACYIRVKYLNARGPRMPEKSRSHAANDITTLGCSRANYICQAAGQAGRRALVGHRQRMVLME